MSEWIDVKAKAKGPVEAEDTDGTPLSRAQLKNKKRETETCETPNIYEAESDACEVVIDKLRKTNFCFRQEAGRSIIIEFNKTDRNPALSL